MKRLVLLGGGHAHVHVVKTLILDPLPNTQVTLVSPFARQVYSGMLPGWIAGHYGIDECVIPLNPLANAANLHFRETSCIGLDPAGKRVRLADGKQLEYDLLSIDTGSVVHPDALPGARENAILVRPIETFIHAIGMLIESAQTRTLAVTVVGGGAAGAEIALALQYRLARSPHAHRFTIVAGNAGMLPDQPASVRGAVLEALRRAEISIVNASAAAIDGDDDARYVVTDGGTRIRSDAPIVAIGSMAPRWPRQAGLAVDEGGCIRTIATMQSESNRNIFAVGDIASMTGHPRPKSGVFAVRAGPPLATNLRRALAGQSPRTHVPQRTALYLIATGGKRGIMSWGPFGLAGGWVWRWKDRIDRRFVASYRA
jgi:pyridine nucleotide-disulfide oxidoreductase family protein